MATSAVIPPLPDGFVLDKPTASPVIPPLPDGFQVDQTPPLPDGFVLDAPQSNPQPEEPTPAQKARRYRATELGPLNTAGGRPTRFNGNPAETTADVVKTIPEAIGKGFGTLGDVSRAAVADVASNVAGREYGGNIAEYVQGNEMPIDKAVADAAQEAKDRGEFPLAATVANISKGVAEVAPKIAALPLAGEGLLAQSIAAGGLFGLDNEGNFHPKEAVIGALMPGVGAAARKGVGMALTKAIESGATTFENPFVQKAVETLGEQSALNAYQLAASSPELIQQYQQDPNAAYSSIAEIVGSNLAFGLLGIKNFHPDNPSATEQFVAKNAEKYADLADQMITRRLVGGEGQRAIAAAVEEGRKAGVRGTGGIELPLPEVDLAPPTPRFTDRGQPVIDIRIQRPDGSVFNAEMNGYYNLSQVGLGIQPSIGYRQGDGGVSHGMLHEGDRLLTPVPTPEQWSQLQLKGAEYADKTRTPTEVGSPKQAVESEAKATEKKTPEGTNVKTRSRVLATERDAAAGTHYDSRQLQSPADSIDTASKLFGDVGDARAILEFGFDSLDIQRKKAVLDYMLGPGHNSKIFDSVVQLIPVDVMHNLVGGEVSSKGSLYNKSVLLDQLSRFGSEPSIVARISHVIDSMATAIPSLEARPGAEYLSLNPREFSGKGISTRKASDDRHGDSVSHLAYTSNRIDEPSNAGILATSEEASLHDRIAVMALERVLQRRAQGAGETAPTLVPSAQSSVEASPARNVARAGEFAKAFGRRIVWFNGDEAVQGALLPQLENVIFVNSKFAARAPEIIVGHELGHAMKVEAPDLFQELHDHIIDRISNDVKLREELRLDYGEHELPDEIVSRAIEAALSDSSVLSRVMGERQTLWRRFINFIRDAWSGLHRRLFPDATTEDAIPLFTNPKEASQKIEKAFAQYRNRIDVGLTESGEGEPKLSIEPFRSSKEFEKIAGAEGVSPEGKERLTKLAQVQSGDIHPDVREAIITRAYTEPQNVQERVARGLIKRTADLISTHDVPVNFAAIQDPQMRSEAAIISTDRHFLLQKESAKIEAARLNAEAAMKLAVQDMQRLKPHSLALDMLSAISDALPKDYAHYLDNLEKTASPNNNLAAVASLLKKRAGQAAGGYLVSPGAIERALQEIADNPTIKTGAEVMPTATGSTVYYPSPSNAEFLNRVRFAGGLKGVNAESQMLLLGGQDGNGLDGVDPLLAKVKNLPDVIEALRAIKAGSDKAHSEIEAFQKAFNPKGNAVGVSTAMKRYASLILKQKAADTILRTVSKSYEKARAMLLGSEEASSLIGDVLNSPAYKQSVNDAAKVIGVQLDGLYNAVESEFRTSGPYPEDQHDYIISRVPTAEQQTKNRAEAELLMTRINDFLNDPNADPIQKASWEKIGQVVQAQWMENISNPLVERKAGYREPADVKHWSIVLSHTRTPQELIRDAIGGPETYDLRKSLDALDQLTLMVRREELNPNYGRKAITNSIAAGAQSHGIDLKNKPNMAEEYRRTILNPIAASLQHHGGIPLRVGDFIPFTSTKITAEDVSAVKVLHDFEQAIRKISEHDLEVYGAPTRILDEFGQKRFQRQSTTTGPVMLTRYYSDGMADWVGRNWSIGLTGDVRAAQVKNLTDQMWSDPKLFEDVVVSYLRETNPEFNRTSAFEKQFRALTERAKSNPLQINSLDDLVDLIAPMRPEPRDEVAAALKAELEREAVRVMDNFAGEVGQDLKPKDANAIDRAVYSSLRTDGSFLKPRGRMVAPSSFYQYAKVADSDIMRTPAVAITIARARNLEKLKQVLAGYRAHLSELESEIDAATSSTTNPKTRREMLNEIDRRARVGEIRYQWSVLHRRINQLQSEVNMSENNLTKFDESFPPALARTALTLNRGVSLQMLGSPGAIMNNLYGGMYIQDAVVNALLRNSGRIISSPLETTREIAKVAMAKTLQSIAKLNPGLAQAVRDNVPFMDRIANVISNNTELVRRMQSVGLLPPFDWSNRRAAKGAVGFGGEILKPGTDVPLHLRGMQWAYTTPMGMLQEMMFPRAFDNFINVVNTNRAMNILLDIVSRAPDIGDVRTRGGKALNPADASQFIAPHELGMTQTQMHNFRTIVEPVGSLESLMFDYYKRLKAADAAGTPRHSVPFADEQKMGAILLSFGKLGNVIAETNTPSFYRGSWLRRVFGTFGNWPANFLAQLEKAIPTAINTKDQRGMLMKLGVIAGVIGVISVAMKEMRGLMMTTITGKESSEPTLTNIMQDPTGIDAAKYLLGAMSAGVPYMSVVLNNAVDSSGAFDLSRTVPLIGWFKDTVGMGVNAVQTGDAAKNFLDYSNRYLPLYSAAINRFPGAQDQLAARNTLRSLRAATPSSIEMRSVSGGGTANPTPLTRYLRSAETAAYAHDAAGMKSALEQAVRAKMQQKGITREQAMNEVRQSLSARQPENRVFGRTLAATERQQILGRMSGRQLRSYQMGQQAYGMLLSALPHQHVGKAKSIFKGVKAMKQRRMKSFA